MQLRKLCNHPFVFREVEQSITQQLQIQGDLMFGQDLSTHVDYWRSSGKFELLDRILHKLKVRVETLVSVYHMQMP